MRPARIRERIIGKSGSDRADSRQSVSARGPRTSRPAAPRSDPAGSVAGEAAEHDPVWLDGDHWPLVDHQGDGILRGLEVVFWLNKDRPISLMVLNSRRTFAVAMNAETYAFLRKY